MAGKKTTTFLIFGNPLLAEDSLPLRILPGLRKEFPEFVFKECDPNENLEEEGRDLNIIDCVEGIEDVTLITEIDSLIPPKVYTMHDFDLGYSLKLLKKMGYIDTVRIFGVPMSIREDRIFKPLVALIKSTLKLD